MEVGSVWGHAGFDIDVAGRTLNGSFFYGECKWRSVAMDLAMVETLRNRSEQTTYGAEKKGKHYLLFSRNGFRAEVEELAKADGSIHLLRLDDLARHPFRKPESQP